MKTPQEAAREYAKKIWKNGRPYKSNVGYATDDFLAGDAFGYRRGMEKAYRWISVLAGLPEDQDDVLVLFCNGRKGIGSYVGNNEWAVVIASEYDSQDLKVIAWRPIERVKE
nr:MAG TPA: Protein of unknown function (DUF551) [Caudoviricetes sp.]